MKRRFRWLRWLWAMRPGRRGYVPFGEWKDSTTLTGFANMEKPNAPPPGVESVPFKIEMSGTVDVPAGTDFAAVQQMIFTQLSLTVMLNQCVKSIRVAPGGLSIAKG